MVKRSGERRNFTRIPFNTEVEIEAGGNRIRSQEGVNVCLSGLHLSTDVLLAPDTPCRITIFLQASGNKLAIEAAGKVVRSAPGSLAVTFTELDLDSYQHLRLLILNNTEQAEQAEQEFRTFLKTRMP